MPKTKEQKQEIIKELKEKVEKQKALVFLDFTGLKMDKITELRKEMKEKNCEFKVVKKTLVQLILKELDPEIGKKIQELEGQIGVAFGYKDEVSPFKIAGDLSETTDNLSLLAGLIGKDFLEKEKALTLSKLPSKEELLARTVGSLRAPISNFVNVLQGNMRGLVYVLSSIKGR